MAPLIPPRPSHPPPPNWPTEIAYLTQPFYSALPSPLLISHLKSNKPPPPTKRPSDNVKIEFVTDRKHPAYGQRGLYAKRDLKFGELIIWYVGEVHLDPEPDPQLAEVRKKSDYDLTLVNKLEAKDGPLAPWDGMGICVDASRMGNEARFINDYRGVPPPPNSSTSNKSNNKKELSPSSPFYHPPKSSPSAFFHSLRASTQTIPLLPRNYDSLPPAERLKAQKDGGELRMGVFVGKKEGIKKGEEILISYGKSFWSSRMGGGSGEEEANETETGV